MSRDGDRRVFGDLMSQASLAYAKFPGLGRIRLVTVGCSRTRWATYTIDTARARLPRFHLSLNSS